MRRIDPSSPPSGFFYGWIVSGGATLAYFFTNGVAYYLPQNLFPRLIEDLGLTVSQVSLAGALTFMVGGVTAPVAGWLIDRFGTTRLLKSGILLLAVAASLYPFATQLWQLYVLHMFFGVTMVTAGLMINVVLLSNWFNLKRGLVVGVLVAGSSLAGFLLPNLISGLVADPNYGWRWGFGLAAALIWLLPVPAVFFFVKDKPADVGQFIDGLDHPPPGQELGQPAPGLTLREAMRTSTLWALAFGSFCLWFSITSVNSQLTIFLEQEAGLPIRQATLLYSLVLGFSVAGKFFFGWLSDHLPKPRVMILSSLTLLAGCLLLFQPQLGTPALTTNLSQLGLFTLVYGMGFGGAFTMIQLVCVASFGHRELGRIMGLVIFIDTAGAVVGITGIGFLKDLTGNYATSFMVVTGMALIGAINMMFIKEVRPALSKA
ncbi:MAG TPA: MFS transporter [Xanthomonadales bacterium]|nr:MFS transporter [Xanthomonadales bacterium]